MKKNLLLGFMILLFSGTALFADVQVKEILKKMDDLQKIDKDVTAKVKIMQKDKEQGNKVMEAIYFARDLSDLFLIVMLAPEAEKGNGYLKADKNFWMYRKNTRTFQHISRNESIAGSDASAEDFESTKYEKNYQGVKDAAGKEVITNEQINKIPVYKVEIFSKVPDISYPKKILWIRQDNFLPLKEQNFSLSGTLMQTQYYFSYTEIDGKFIAVKLLAVDEFEKGNSTLWEISNIVFKPLSDTIFTKAYLENLSK